MISSVIISFLIMLVISSAVAVYFYYFKKMKMIGKLYGGIIFAFIGAVLLNYLLHTITLFFSNTFNINLLSVLIGAILFIKLLNKVTP